MTQTQKDNKQIKRYKTYCETCKKEVSVNVLESPVGILWDVQIDDTGNEHWKRIEEYEGEFLACCAECGEVLRLFSEVRSEQKK